MKNPLGLLIAILITGLLSLLLIRLQLPPETPSHTVQTISLLCIGGWLLLVLFCSRLARILIKTVFEPQIEAKAKLLSVCQDVSTDLNIADLSTRAASALDAAKQREKLIADYSSDFIFCLNHELKFIEANLRAEVLLGYSVASLLGTAINSTVFPPDLASLLKYLQRVKEGEDKELIEFRVKAVSGALIDLELQSEWSTNLNCYFCLCRDITDKKQNQRLRADVAAMITHDLRSPIAGISYFMESLSKGLYGELPQQAKLELNNAKIGVENVLAMINQLLEAEKLEGGSLQSSPEYIPLSDLYDQCGSLLAALAKKKDLSIQFPESSAIIFADFNQMQQVLSNLLTNAIKFSPIGASISIREHETNDTITVSVVDCGPGVANSSKESIFEKFKSDNSIIGEPIVSSTGLGLYISRKLLALQGGDLSVRDATTGGADFYFTLKKVRKEELELD